jgi:hypothetical protein
MKESISRLGHLTQVIFIGDSTFYRLSKDRKIWEELERKHAAIMMACSSDKTENILYRLNHSLDFTEITTTPLIFVMIGQ